MPKTILILFLLFSTQSAWSGSASTAIFKIKYISFSENDDAVAVFPTSGNAVINPAKCTKADRFYFNLPNSYRSNRIVGALTTLATTKSDTAMYVYDDRCVKKGNDTFPQAVSVQIR